MNLNKLTKPNQWHLLWNETALSVMCLSGPALADSPCVSDVSPCDDVSVTCLHVTMCQ